MLGKKKENNKRVLRAGNGRQKSSNNKKYKSSKSQIIKRNDSQLPPYMKKNSYAGNNQKQKKYSSLTFILIIIALIAFVVGAGFGVSLSFHGDDDKGQLGDSYVDNVTDEMTTNVTSSNQATYDKHVDDVDYNNAEDLAKHNITDNGQAVY